MGWINVDAPDHEGYIALITDDGREAKSSTSEGVWVLAVVGDRDAALEVRDDRGPAAQALIPWERVLLWRVQCTCGWVGGMRPAVETDPSGQRECPEALEDDVFLPQWQNHIASVTALADLRELAAQRVEVERKIDRAAPLARAAGHSWSEIGAAVGISKQAAQQRWGTSTIDPARAQRRSWTPGEQPRSLPSPQDE